MKKKKIIILVIIALIIIGIIAGIKMLSKKEENVARLSKIYDEISSSKTYLFTMIQNDSNKVIMAKKDNKTAIDQYANNEHTTTIVKDGNTYLILHDRQEYYVYLRNNIEQNILTEGLAELKDKEFTVGTEKIKGKKYDYEEYNVATIFTVANNISLDEENVKTRFYFDKNKKLAYIKTTYGNNQELLQVELSSEVDDSLFEIPSNYAEN